jgi:hypothetical protein
LGAYLVQRGGPHGTWSRMARLNKPEWSNNTDEPLGSVPYPEKGYIWQSINLPRPDCDQGILLSFWYQIQGYDTWWGVTDGNTGQQGLIDSFDVYIRDQNGNALKMVLRDGIDDKPAPHAPTIRTLPWRQARIDLTPWAGQTIQIQFEMWNRVDDWYPTWVYIDDVRLLPADSRTMHLPLVTTIPSRVRLTGPAPTPHPTPWPPIAAPEPTLAPGERAAPWR